MRGHGSGGQAMVEGASENSRAPRRCLWEYEGSGAAHGDGLEMDKDYGELSGFVALEPGAQRSGVAQPNLLNISRGLQGSFNQRGAHSGPSVDEVDSEHSGEGLGLNAVGRFAQRGGLMGGGDPRASRRTGQWVEEHASASRVDDPPLALEEGYGYVYGPDLSGTGTARARRPRRGGELSGSEGSILDGARSRGTRRDGSSASGDASGRDSGSVGTPTTV